MQIELSAQDVQDLIDAIDSAQQELCIDDEFPEATALDARWSVLIERLEAMRR